MIELRPYQREAVDKIKPILKERNLAYLAAEVRTGKNFMSFATATELGWRKVLFVTKKSAFAGVQSDYQKWDQKFQTFDLINFESVHKCHPIYDAYIIDEAHSIGAFPKPGVACKKIHDLIYYKQSPCLLMSGTPTAETPTEIFFQMWVSPYTPFQGYGHRSGEFYGWAKEYVDVKQKRVNGFFINDYKKAHKEKIDEVMKHYLVTVSQDDAGFRSKVEEEIFYVDPDPKKDTFELMKRLKAKKIYQLKSGDYIVADTPARMQQCFHQISSGTIITGEGNERKYHTLEESKVWFIKQKFAGQKIAIYYYFQQEGEVLRKHFPNHTDNPELFNKRNDLVYINQMISGAMGVNVSTCDWLVMYNIWFSAKIYWQVRARMQTMDRTKPSKLAWIFSRNGMEKAVLGVLQKKKDFQLRHFQREFLNLI